MLFSKRLVLAAVLFLPLASMMPMMGARGQAKPAPDLFSKLFREILDAEAEDLPELESRINELRDNPLPPEEYVRLIDKIAYEYRGSNPERARDAARRVLDDPVFDKSSISPHAANSWAMAASTYRLVVSQPKQDAFITSVASEIKGSARPVGLRIRQLRTVLDGYFAKSHALPEMPDEGRELAEEQLPRFLDALSDDPSHWTLRSMWRLDNSLRRVNASPALRLKLLKRGSEASERAMQQSRPFHRDHFSNLWHFRLHMARLLADEGKDARDVLSVLEGMEDFKRLFEQQLQESDNAESMIAQYRNFHASSIEKVKQLAEHGHVLGPDSLAGKHAPQFDLELVDKKAPDHELEMISGDRLSWTDLRGRVVVLDFWAVWCVPCIKAFPDLRELDAKFDDEEVLVVGVTKRFGYRLNESEDRIEQATDATYEQESTAIRHFVAKHDLQIPQVLDRGEIVEKYRVKSWPTTVVIDQEGVVRFVGSIGGGGFEELVATIETLLEK